MVLYSWCDPYLPHRFGTATTLMRMPQWGLGFKNYKILKILKLIPKFKIHILELSKENASIWYEFQCQNQLIKYSILLFIFNNKKILTGSFENIYFFKLISSCCYPAILDFPCVAVVLPGRPWGTSGAPLRNFLGALEKLLGFSCNTFQYYTSDALLVYITTFKSMPIIKNKHLSVLGLYRGAFQVFFARLGCPLWCPEKFLCPWGAPCGILEKFFVPLGCTWSTLQRLKHLPFLGDKGHKIQTGYPGLYFSIFCTSNVFLEHLA